MRTKSILSLVAALMSFGVLAVPVSVEQAEKAVGNWLRCGRSLEKAMGRKVAASRRCVTTNGVPFHVVKLEGGGFVVTSGDTMIEPVVAYSADADLVEDERNPLWVLVRRDLANRAAKASSVAPLKMASGAANGGAAATPEERWAELISPSALRYGAAPQEDLADVRVAPLVKSRWGQTKNSCYLNHGDVCYNYYTPNNYCCGCVATAMAQIMRCHRYPTSVTVASRNCKVDGVTTLLTMKGGTYDWANMKLVPEASTSLDWYDGGATATEREAIGKLTYDCGVAMYMSYASGGSGSLGSFAHDPIKNVFKYKNAVSYLSQSSISVDLQKQIMNPNFDAGYPVMVSVYGHEIIADGYGYSGSVLFTHLNMGWDGIDDVWYNLPDIECPKTGETYDYIDGIVYNIFPDKTGDIFSGRVTDASGKPIAGATVTVRKSSSSTTLGTMVTGANGIYAFILTGGTKYVATATYGGASASCTAKTLTKSVGPHSVNLQTGKYSSTGMTAGNSWGNDIRLTGLASVATPVLSPAGGLFYPTVEVRISCATAGATIRYTTDGSNPTDASSLYTGPILIDDDLTLKVRAFKSGMNASATVVAEYVYDASQDAPKGDCFNNPIAISGSTGTKTITGVSSFSMEEGEPLHTLENNRYSSQYQTVWFKWTAPGSGSMVFTTGCVGSYFYPTAVAVYEGTGYSDIIRKAMSKDYQSSGDYTTSVSVDVEQGKTYRIVGVTLYDVASDTDAELSFFWSGDLTIASGETAVTDEVPIPVKYDWLAAHFPSAAASGYQNLVTTHGANGLLVWESYMLGLDPSNPTNDFRILSFTMRDGMPVVQGNVDSDRVKGFGFEMKVKGKRDLVSDNEVWSTDLGGKNYFKVFVEPK